jgi:hypothetical protein
MLINYDTAILMARRQPTPQVGHEVKAYNKGWEIIKSSGKDIRTISIDLQRDLTDAEKSYLKA